MSETAPEPVAHARQGKAWSVEEDRQLHDGFVGGLPVEVIAARHGRSAGGIRARLGRLGLIDEYGAVVTPAPSFVAQVRARPAAPGASSSAADEGSVKSVFAIRTVDGWVVDIKSNRPLSRPLVDRLTSMLHRVLEDDDLR
jgi:hypothetical protein